MGIIHFERKRRVRVAAAAIQSILVLILSYFLWNSKFSFDDDGLLQQLFILCENKIKTNHPDSSNVLFFDVGYDKVLMDVYDEDGFSQGSTSITDRNKLYQLLSVLSSTDTYDYILLDINFDTSFSSDIDTLLFPLIASMRDIVVPSNTRENDIPSILEEKSGIAEYNASLMDLDFHRYKYLIDGKESIALKIWKDKTGGNYLKRWFGYTMDKRLCVNYPRIYFPFVLSEYSSTGDKSPMKEKNYKNLGADFLEIMDAYPDLPYLFKDKFVIIGDIENDSHDTVVGPMPGSIILYNAFLSLMGKKNVVPVWVWIMLFSISFVVSLHVFGVIDTDIKIKSNYRIIVSLISEFFSYSILFTLLGLLVYVTTHIMLNVFLFSIIFTLENLFIKPITNHNTIKK